MYKSKNLNSWDKTRDQYVNWVSNNKLKFFFTQNMLIDQYSVWWSTSVVSKDNVIKRKWYIDLHNKLNGKKNSINFDKIFLFPIIIIKFFKNLLFQIIFNLIIKLVSRSRYTKTKKKNCFHSYDYNFFFNQKESLYNDRLYNYAYLKNKNQSFYLITIIKKKIFFKNLLNFKSSKFEYFIADEFINIFEIINIYFKTLKLGIKLLYFLKKNNHNKFFLINKKDCESVLKPFLLNSFAGEIQNSIIRAKMIKNFSDKNYFKKFINYGEFTPGYRPTYFFLKKSKSKPKIITVQHSNSNYNLLYSFNKKTEFAKKKSYKIGVKFSPQPDLYLTHGSQFNNQIKKYFKKTKIIGPLKYDHHFITNNKKIFLKKNKNNLIKNILICPSVGDHETILDLLTNSVSFKHNYILSPHPTYKIIYNQFRTALNKICNFSYNKNRSTYDYLTNVDLVLCSWSSIANEAMYLGIPAIRLIKKSEPYYHDVTDMIKTVDNSKELKKVLLKDNFNNLFPKHSSRILKNFYHNLDNKAHQRFWRAV